MYYNGTIVASEMATALFEASKVAFEICLGLVGVMAFWLGLLRIAEKAGIVEKLARLVNPVFKVIFPEIPENHPAFSSMMMNIAANMLGLDNSATPMGIKAMQDLQKTNKNEQTASNAQIMFLILNTSGLTLIPSSIIALRVLKGAENPADIFIPTLMATSIATIFGILIVSLKQRINLFKPAFIIFFGAIVLINTFIMSKLSSLSSSFTDELGNWGNIIILAIVLFFIVFALIKKVAVFDEFIIGAKESFPVAINIVPYIVAMLCAIALFKSSGALDILLLGIKKVVLLCGVSHTEFVDALPTGLMRPFSGSGARAILISIFEDPNLGPDSLAGKMGSVMQGSTETTLYTLAVYYGAVKVKNTRYTASFGLLTDLIALISAIVVSYAFFG